MKKATLLFAVLGCIFFAACAKEESKTVDTTGETATTPSDDAVDTTMDTAVTTATDTAQ